jgi:carboxyl-terminal processing protease
MLQALSDPYSEYLDEEQLESLSYSVEGEYTGIGVTVESAGGSIRVVSTFADSPAARAGVKSGDVIVGADGVDLRGKTTGEAAQVLRGQAGTTVNVTISRPSTGETLSFTMVREVIRQQSLALDDLGDGKYYIKISQFTTDTARQFPVIMNYFRLRGLKGLVLDLRDNPGGLLESCIDIAKQLVPKGPIVELRRKELKQVIQSGVDTVTVPVVVLVNGGSASASEILAGAIRDRGVGILVGEPTFGKACIQSIIPLGDDLGGIRLTIADYYTPAGTSLAGKGLDPNVLSKPVVLKSPGKLAVDRLIRPGLVGLDVQALQQTLAFLGYLQGEADGIYGARTREALDAFCARQGLQPDGQIDGRLADELQEAVSARIKEAPDSVLDMAKGILQSRLSSGHW